MMKKILVLMLAIACAFTMFSCSCNDGDGEKSKYSLKDFTDSVNATAPAKITLNTKVATQYGDLNSQSVTTFNEDGSFTLVHWYEKFNLSSEGESDVLIDKVEMTVECDKDGKWSDGADHTAKTTGHKLNLDAKKMKYTISNDGTALSATVLAADTEAVFGVNFGADVTLVLVRSAGKISSFSLTYTSAQGKVESTCSYN